MGYLKIWVHAVWTTKYRNKVLTKDIRRLVFEHIRENARQKNIYRGQ